MFCSVSTRGYLPSFAGFLFKPHMTYEYCASQTAKINKTNPVNMNGYICCLTLLCPNYIEGQQKWLSKWWWFHSLMKCKLPQDVQLSVSSCPTLKYNLEKFGVEIMCGGRDKPPNCVLPVTLGRPSCMLPPPLSLWHVSSTPFYQVFCIHHCPLWMLMWCPIL